MTAISVAISAADIMAQRKTAHHSQHTVKSTASIFRSKCGHRLEHSVETDLIACIVEGH